MADATRTTKIYKANNGDDLVVASGGKITADGSQAANIADIGDLATGAQIATAVNAILAALEGVGITAAS